MINTSCKVDKSNTYNIFSSKCFVLYLRKNSF